MEVKTNCEQYAAYKEKQESLAKMIEGSGALISELEMKQYAKNLDALGAKVHNDSFKIQIVGSFKNGKSTFINSFLGEDILPAYTLPCTAVINEVKWGAEKKAILHFKHPLPEQLPESIPEKAIAHMNAHKGNPIPPMDIPYDEIEDYAVIPYGEDPKEMLLESPYSKIELFWPLPLLENGIEIIDSPGLNEHATRTKVTMDYLSQADAILFVLNASQLCSMEEMRFIENNLKEQGFTDPFFVVNRFDTVPEREKPRMKSFAHQKLAGFSSNEIYYVSALQALDGKLEGDTEKYEKSGMKEFEQRLSEFLTKEKGRAKLSQPARELKKIINDEALFKVIPARRNMLACSLDDVKNRYEKAKPKIKILEAKKEQIVTKLENRIELSRSTFRREVASNSEALCQLVPQWVEEAQVTASLGMVPSKEKVKAYVNELIPIVSAKIETHQTKWAAETFSPILSEKMTEIMNSIEFDLQDFYSNMDSINSTVMGIESNEESNAVWERIASMSGELTIAELSVDKVVSRQIIKTLAISFGGGFLLSLFSLLNPITLVAAIAGAILMGSGGKEKKIKTEISNKIVDHIRTTAEEQADKISESILAKLREQAGHITDALDGEINESQNQIDNIIKELEDGQANVDKKTAELEQNENTLKAISSELDTFIFKLMEN